MEKKDTAPSAVGKAREENAAIAYTIVTSYNHWWAQIKSMVFKNTQDIIHWQKISTIITIGVGSGGSGGALAPLLVKMH